jgi:NodT family efflux transporter outer membrane factor (OMF) lipoprotein
MLVCSVEPTNGKLSKASNRVFAWRLLLSAVPWLFLVSCMVGPNYKTPKAEVEPRYVATNGVAEKPVSPADAYWWKVLNDPVLNALIETAHRNNLSLQVAGVRVLGARAQLNKSIGNLFPQQQAVSGALNYRRLNSPDKAFSPSGLNEDYFSDQGLFSASWELDFWGKYRRTIESDRATFLGTVASYEDALVTLIADVATTYVNIRTTEERIRVAERNVERQKESYRVAYVQFKYGSTSELSVRQAATILSQTEATIPHLQQTLAQAKNGLAVLLGVTPDQVDKHLAGEGHIPVVPRDVASGIPHDLLRRRPDVRAAGLTAASQCALIGVAKANMYPALTLSGAFGFASNNEREHSLGDMFMWQNRSAQAGASLVWPVFNYGRLINQVRVQDASFEQAVLNYQNTVLTAQQEVENGLSAFYNEQQALTNLVVAADEARRSTELSMIQYKAGETDYTTVLSTEQSELSVEDSMATSQGAVVQGLIAVYRALGGGWELRQGLDVISDEVKTDMTRRTRWGEMLEPQKHLPKNSLEAQR